MKTIKHLLTLAFAATTCTSAVAQTTESTAAESTTAITIETKTDTSVSTTTRTYKNRNRVTSDFNVYLGINNFAGTLPTGYEFRPIGSRFVALSWQKRIPLVTTGSTKFRLVTGPEIAWNNFMFEGNNTLINQNNQVSVEPYPTDVRKSKFVTTQLNLPVMLNVAFGSGFTWSVGGYAGVRLDSYTAVKPVGSRPVRTHGSFNLNPIRWGLTTELGFRHEAKLFIRYEPNSPFRANQGPDASVWAVGVKL